MFKKIALVLVFVALIGSGAFAQLMFGVSGALHTDSRLSAQEIQDRFSKGEGIFYGPQAELAFGNLGIGLAVNLSLYTTTGNTYAGPYIIPAGFALTDYDITFYLSYHLFGARSFLDPFAELGGGVLATGFTEKADQDAYNPYTDNFLSASNYWYGALGLGLNLGGLGVFGKVSYNHSVGNRFKTTYVDEMGGGDTEMLPYGADPLFPNGYLPAYRITLGVKLIL